MTGNIIVSGIYFLGSALKDKESRTSPIYCVTSALYVPYVPFIHLLQHPHPSVRNIQLQMSAYTTRNTRVSTPRRIQITATPSQDEDGEVVCTVRSFTFFSLLLPNATSIRAITGDVNGL